MNERREEIAGEKHKSKDQLTKASDNYRRHDAAVSNKKKLIKKYEKDKEKAKGQTTKDEIQGKIDRLKLDIVQIEKYEDTENNISREDVAEFTMATELRDANRKRVVRQGVHIAAEFTKIAGAIATLTGTGAMAGGVLKGAAAATELSLPVARLAKQKARDNKAEKMAKKRTGDMNILRESKFFQIDESKSTAAKNDFRVNQVKYLIGLTIDLLYKKGKAFTSAEQNIKKYMEASGVNKTKLYNENGNPQKQVSLLLEAFKQREL